MTGGSEIFFVIIDGPHTEAEIVSLPMTTESKNKIASVSREPDPAKQPVDQVQEKDIQEPVDQVQAKEVGVGGLQKEQLVDDVSVSDYDSLVDTMRVKLMKMILMMLAQMMMTMMRGGIEHMFYQNFLLLVIVKL